MWMKDSEGFYTILVWIVEREYDVDCDGWDYKVRQRNVEQTDWIGGVYVRAEKELKKA